MVFPTVHRAGATPVPIPNTEVKPCFGDGTAGFPGGRVARRWDLLGAAPIHEDRRRFHSGAATLIFLLVCARSALAADLELQPADAIVRFTLGATLHTVEGSAALVRGSLRFDPNGGAADGRIVVDATSMTTGNALRDTTLHDDVLESARYPEIVFAPKALEIIDRGKREARVVLAGRIALRGREHALRIPALLRVEGDRLRVVAHFTIPFVAWGLHDPSNFLLSVEKEVKVTVDVLAATTPVPLELGAERID